MNPQDDDSEKPFEPTPNKLRNAREKGEIAKSSDLSVVAAYVGLAIAVLTVGKIAVEHVGTLFLILIEQSGPMSLQLVRGSSQSIVAEITTRIGVTVLAFFAIPAAAVLLSLVAQRAFLLTPNKLKPRLSRISVISNARNKFGRQGLFEFAKSFVKLVLYSVCLALFLRANLAEIITSSAVQPRSSILLMMNFLTRFLAIVIAVALIIGVVDYIWQYSEHIRKNRMSRKEILDETKDSEGDPHMKQQRQRRAQDIAANQMMSNVPTADVVVVNPTHYAVALKWSRAPGEAPVCVAKGVDEIAAAIRAAAEDAGVPVHPDPPTARALHATVAIGQEIPAEHYRPVAAAIRFAEAMRKRAKGQVG